MIPIDELPGGMPIDLGGGVRAGLTGSGDGESLWVWIPRLDTPIRIPLDGVHGWRLVCRAPLEVQPSIRSRNHLAEVHGWIRGGLWHDVGDAAPASTA